MSSACPVSRFSKIFLAPFCPSVKRAFRSLFRIEAYGLENIPKEPCIVVSNHRSHLDPPVLNSVFPEPLRFLAKEELFKVPILGKLLPHMGALPVKRGSGDLEVLELALELMHFGCKVGIFPEGTRADPGEFLRPKLGVGLLAIKSQRPVLPVYIEGTDKVFPRGAKFPKPGHPIRVFIGKSKVYYDEDNLKGYRRVAEDIMESIKELARAKDSEHSRIP
ncbi:lysophospholipid acyltransferase family protein [Hydrogenobacter sp. T-2]|uniref:lysophospholipid acyltransferase family protein n=1 Tax=Pampinifervens diazotrophicum TaxID=1632018 RepID=UPI002B25B1BE|nr:lysophospholipid acyltransferase family protein [Hydrogenobacter sp. T-2]WPM31789.1 lysophospholipid acyltransferase family protein [Hydrogenobacter sp. T-2]